MLEHRLPLWEKILLFLVLVGLVGILAWNRAPKGDIRYHLLLMGVSKGHITPSVAIQGPRQGKLTGGAAFTSALIESTISGFKGEPCSVLSLGGEISGTPEAYFTKGSAVVESLNSYHLDAMLIGNIEFTFGQIVLEELAKKANFSLMSSNIFKEGTEAPPAYLLAEKILRPSRNLTVGLLGITPPATPDITVKTNVAGLKFGALGPDLQEKVRGLKAKGVDLVILMSQFNTNSLQPDDWQWVRQAKPDIFLMLDFNPEPVPPTIRDGVLIQSFNGYNQGQELDVLDLVISDKPNPITQFLSRRLPIACEEITPNPQVAAAQKESLNQVNLLKAQKIGEFAGTVQRNYDRECPIGNLVCDAMRVWGKKEIAFQNSGGIQSDIKAGAFTLGDLYDVLPFSNEIVTMELSGIDIRELLTLSASVKRGVLQVSGCSYAFANRGVEDFDLKSVTIDGKPIVATRTYKIITNSFLAEGGDEFKTFRKGRDVQFGPLQRDIVQSYIEKACASGPLHLATEGRILRD